MPPPRSGKIVRVLDHGAKQSYSRVEVRRVLGISERRLRSWERQDLIPSSATYGFTDLIALRTLLKLTSNRVTPGRIQRVLASLRTKLSSIENPLTELKIACEGRKITVQLGGSTMEPISGQLLFDFDGAELKELKKMLSFRQEKKAPPPRDTQQSEFWFQKGLAAEKTGVPIESAIEDYQKALSLDPQSTGALVNLGTIYFHLRRWPEAEEYYLKALAADANYALAHFNLGNLFDEQGEHDQAILHYLEALRLDPSYADAHYNLALLYQSMGQMKALPHWKTYLKLDPSSSWSTIARQQLEKLMQSTVFEGSRDKGA